MFCIEDSGNLRSIAPHGFGVIGPIRECIIFQFDGEPILGNKPFHPISKFFGLTGTDIDNPQHFILIHRRGNLMTEIGKTYAIILVQTCGERELFLAYDHRRNDF